MRKSLLRLLYWGGMFLSLWSSGASSIFMKEILDLILLIARFISDAKGLKSSNAWATISASFSWNQNCQNYCNRPWTVCWLYWITRLRRIVMLHASSTRYRHLVLHGTVYFFPLFTVTLLCCFEPFLSTGRKTAIWRFALRLGLLIDCFIFWSKFCNCLNVVMYLRFCNQRTELLT